MRFFKKKAGRGGGAVPDRAGDRDSFGNATGTVYSDQPPKYAQSHSGLMHDWSGTGKGGTLDNVPTEPAKKNPIQW